jgi:nitroimidazol reductase NimA-like FMN-containing flavoprotein (pyridoxamine 5'-phosphate oxidase superfamily)
MMVGLLSCEEIEALLQRQCVGRIGCSVDERPYIVPMRYLYDGAAVYAVSGPGRKIDAMRAQSLVCFEVDEIDGTGTWRSVIASGVFSEITDDAERRSLLRYLGVAWAGPDGGDSPPPSSIIVFSIRLLEKSGRFGRDVVADSAQAPAHASSASPEVGPGDRFARERHSAPNAGNDHLQLLRLA